MTPKNAQVDAIMQAEFSQRYFHQGKGFEAWMGLPQVFQVQRKNKKIKSIDFYLKGSCFLKLLIRVSSFPLA